MNLLLHYLKYDLRRWRLLIILLWVLTLLETGLMFLQGRVIQDGDTAFYASIPARTLWVVLGGGHAVLCLMAGGMDSPRAASTWLMTRPRSARHLVLSRILLLLGGGVLPILLTWLLSLAAFGFDGGTIGAALPYFLLTVVSCTAALALWALTRPFVPGVILGAAATGLVFLLGFTAVRFTHSFRHPDWFYQRDADFLSISAPLALAALSCLKSVRHRITRCRNAFMGATAGAIAAIGVAAILPLQAWLFERSSFDTDYQLRHASRKELQVRPGALAGISRDSSRITIRVPLADSETMRTAFPVTSRIAALSWRESPSAPWSGWTDAHLSTPKKENEWTLTFWISTNLIEAMTDGEFRVALENPPVGINDTVTFTPGTPAAWTGAGWVVNLHDADMEGEPRLRYTTHSLSAGNLRLRFFEEDLMQAGFHSTGDRSSYVSLPFVRSAWVTLATARNSGTTPNPARPTRLALSRPATASELFSVVHVSGVTFTMPGRAAPGKPEDPEVKMLTASQREWRKFPVQQYSEVWLPGGKPPSPPGKDAPVHEAARWLQSIFNHVDWRQPNREAARWSAVDAAALQSIATSHPDLIIRMIEERDPMIPGALVDALRKHLPDSARPLIIPRIPKARTLALLARDRGWLEEARPVVLRTLLEDGGVPNEWETLLRPDRLPDFVVLTPTPCYLNQPGAVPWQQDLSALRIEWSGPRSSGTTALETSIAGRVRAVLEESRKASEPEFHLSLQFCEFLAHGEEPALTALLGVLVHHGEEVTPWHGVLARQWLRSAGGAELPAAPGSLRTALHPLRADHFEFDRAQCLWIRRNPPVP